MIQNNDKRSLEATRDKLGCLIYREKFYLNLPLVFIVTIFDQEH